MYKSKWNLHSEEGFLFFSISPFKDTNTISLIVSSKFFFPDGEIKKPSLSLSLLLIEILPDLIGEKLSVENNLEYFTISFFFINIIHFLSLVFH